MCLGQWSPSPLWTSHFIPTPLLLSRPSEMFSLGISIRCVMFSLIVLMVWNVSVCKDDFSFGKSQKSEGVSHIWTVDYRRAKNTGVITCFANKTLHEILWMWLVMKLSHSCNYFLLTEFLIRQRTTTSSGKLGLYFRLKALHPRFISSYAQFKKYRYS